MPTLLERLRDALRPDYEVERELAGGGMGIVFLAREVTLRRPVAVKIIRPELATERAAHRFLREARILATLNHPNVMPVHRAGEADGLFYYVMDYYEGATLADRLKRGKLSVASARKLGRDLLDALEAVHRLGVIHRDIKPGNVYLIQGRAVLADFGLARPSPEIASSTSADRAGTLGYMAPEQVAGEDITPRADLYAVGIVLCEAFTGRRWTGWHQPDWTGIPRSIVPILKRALALEADQRWPDAATFRRKLWKTRTRRYRRRTLLLTIAGLTVGAIAASLLLRPTRATTDVAVLPFSASSPEDSALARSLSMLAEIYLREFFNEGVTPPDLVRQWHQENDGSGKRIDKADLVQLHTRNAVVGRLVRSGSAVAVDVEVVRRNGRVDSAGTVQVTTRGETAERIGLNAVRIISPNDVERYPVGGVLSDLPESALAAFVDGEAAFHRNAWRTAVRHYRDAFAIDSSFALAAWGLSNAWRWLRTGSPSPEVDLRQLVESKRSALLDLDRRLIDAQLEPTLGARLRRYEETLERYPLHGYAAFLYADELLHRGAFIGLSVDTAIGALAAAVTKDSSLGPALDHLIWANLRVGNRDASARWLARLQQVAAGPEEVDIFTPGLLKLAYVERFEPERAEGARREVAGDPQLAGMLINAFRLAAMLGLPHTQLALGQMLEPLAAEDSETLGSVYVAQALALVALGRVGEALDRLHRAATILGSDDASLQAAQWYLILPVLGVPGVSPAQRAQARSALEGRVADTAVGTRAAWTLGLDAAEGGDTVTLAQAIETIRRSGDAEAASLATLLEAVRDGMRKRFQAALDRSASVIALDSAGQAGDPFARAVAHMKRAEWLDSLGRSVAADSAQRWYEHFDFIGMPSGHAQAAEIDWALGTYAMWQRGSRDVRQKRNSACGHFRRVLEFWAEADSDYGPLASRAREYIRDACPP